MVKYRNKWAKSSKVDKRVLSEWKNAVLDCIKNRIGMLKKRSTLINVRNKF